MKWPDVSCRPHHLGGAVPLIWLLPLLQHQGHLTGPPVAFEGPRRKLPEARNADNQSLIKRKPIVWQLFKREERKKALWLLQ